MMHEFKIKCGANPGPGARASEPSSPADSPAPTIPGWPGPPCIGRWATPEKQRQHEESLKPKPGGPPPLESLCFEWPTAEAGSLLAVHDSEPLAVARRAVDASGLHAPEARPDGFSQSAVDAVKAALLATERGGK